MAIRGLSAVNLAKQARLSNATISNALAGKPIAEASIMLIVEVLKATAPSEFLTRLVAPVGMLASDGQHPASPLPDGNDHLQTARPRRGRLTGGSAARERGSWRRSHRHG